MKGLLSHIILYELLQGKLLNAVVFPVAYNFRDNVEKGSFLWGFLNDDHLYGDATYNPESKKTFWKAYMWALRNPLDNKYYSKYLPNVEKNITGIATTKYHDSIGTWRTYKTETGDRNGKTIDYVQSIFGEQNIEFDIEFEDGRIEKGFRRSICKPVKIGNKIVIYSSRFGYERGLLQSSFNANVFKGKENLRGFDEWEKVNWITIIS